MAQPAPQQVTIGDVLRLALPLSVTVVAGGDFRQRAVNWAATLISWEVLGQQVRAGDLVVLPAILISAAVESQITAGVRELAALEVAGILSFGSLPDETTNLARDLNLPLLLVPASSSLRDIQQNVTALLLDRQKQTSERGMQLYRRLSEMSREGQGLAAMAEVMSQLTGKIIVVQDKRLEIQAISRPASSPIDEAPLLRWLSQRDNLPPLLRNRKAVAKVAQSYWQQLLPIEAHGSSVARLVSPIISGDRARGYVSAVGLADELDMLDTLTVEHGAAACALEMAKAKAISETKKALRGDFLEGLLAGTLPAKEIERLESRLDHDTRQLHAVLTFTWNSPNAPSLRRLTTTINWLLTTHNRPALLHVYSDDHACVFQALKSSDGANMSTAQELERRVREQIEAEFPEARLVAGISGPAANLSEWPTVYREAVQAMRLGQRLNLNRLVDFHSLGVFQLLGQIEDIPAVRAFCEQVIGPLVKYDEEHHSSLVQTMDAYFAHHGNISQTAESLFIHRNTLLYRLDRIQELTGQNLNQADMRLAMHLSLKLWQLRPKAHAAPQN